MCVFRTKCVVFKEVLEKSVLLQWKSLISPEIPPCMFRCKSIPLPWKSLILSEILLMGRISENYIWMIAAVSGLVMM